MNLRSIWTCVLLVTSLVVYSQNAPELTQAENKSEETDFAYVLQTHLSAVENKDTLSLKSTLDMTGAYDLILPDGSKTETAVKFYEMQKSWFEGENWTMDMTTLQSESVSDMGFALVQADYREADRGGKPYHHKMWITYVLKKVEGAWKVVYDHASTAEKTH